MRLIVLARTAQEWSDKNLVLGEGQVGRVKGNTKLKKLGDGTTPWNDLPYVSFNPAVKVTALGNSGTAKTIPDAVATDGTTVATVTLTGTCTFTMPAVQPGAQFELLAAQDGTGTRLATFTGVKWPGGTAPTLTTTASKRDRLKFVSDGVDWFGVSVGLNYV